MAHAESREVLLLGVTTVTTSGTGSVINVPMGYSACIAHVSTNTVSGTSPTLNVYIQHQVSDAAAADTVPGPPTGTARYQDMIAFTQVTTTGQCPFAVNATGNSFSATAGAFLQQDGTLTAGNVNVGPIGGNWRVKWVVTGTSPSFTFNVTAALFPQG